MGLQRPIECVYQKGAQDGHYYAECSNHQYWRMADGMIGELCLHAVGVEDITECTKEEERGEKQKAKVLHCNSPAQLCSNRPCRLRCITLIGASPLRSTGLNLAYCSFEYRHIWRYQPADCPGAGT